RLTAPHPSPSHAIQLPPVAIGWLGGSLRIAGTFCPRRSRHWQRVGFTAGGGLGFRVGRGRGRCIGNTRRRWRCVAPLHPWREFPAGYQPAHRWAPVPLPIGVLLHLDALLSDAPNVI